ncbi:MAG: hypothetical protein K6G12_08950 [Lachnospiraceae bacterium]|nr:hypothetical protein [Lachnospiraceae bacterium]
MGVGAIGAIGSVTYDPYIYNTRQVSAASLNSISRISDDATEGGVDFSSVNKISEQANINPLKKGETADFAGVLMSQMSMSRIHQSQLLGSPEEIFESGAVAELADDMMMVQ